MGEKLDKAKGKIKQTVGAMTENDEMRRRGERDELKGKAKGVVQGVKDAVKHAVRQATK